MRPIQVMIVAGEASGDLHGARLVEAMLKRRSDISFCGIGGIELASRGMEILFNAASIAVVGLFEVLGHIRDIRLAMRTMEEEMERRRPALLILIDFPDFNLILAGKARKLGIPVYYYISPQVWAWRSGRVKKIADRVERMAVILPFEKDFYQKKGMAVDFVGHPLLDSVSAPISKDEFRTRLKLRPDTKLVGLLPGSRKREVETLLPVFFEAAKRLAGQTTTKTAFLLVAAPGMDNSLLSTCNSEGMGIDCHIIREDRYSAMQACDVVMAASGTVTLELAILQTPMVVAYRVSPFSYLVGRRLIKVEYVTLVNLVAGKKVVPELLQENAEAASLCREVRMLLENETANQEMRKELGRVKTMLGSPGASDRAAVIALEIIDHGQASSSGS